jgi:hypothetical protein
VKICKAKKRYRLKAIAHFISSGGDMDRELQIIRDLCKEIETTGICTTPSDFAFCAYKLLCKYDMIVAENRIMQKMLNEIEVCDTCVNNGRCDILKCEYEIDLKGWKTKEI